MNALGTTYMTQNDGANSALAVERERNSRYCYAA
jgi:hypothetical protein